MFKRSCACDSESDTIQKATLLAGGGIASTCDPLTAVAAVDAGYLEMWFNLSLAVVCSRTPASVPVRQGPWNEAYNNSLWTGTGSD